MNYGIYTYHKDELTIMRLSDGFRCRINTKDFSITLLNCQILMPYKTIRCEDIKIQMKLIKKPKDFKQISFDLILRSDDYIVNNGKSEYTLKYDKLLVHNGDFYFNGQVINEAELPTNVKMVDGLPQYTMEF